MSAAIKPLDTPERRAAYADGDFPRADRVKDLNLRYRWDLYWASKINNSNEMREAYTPRDGINDAHLDTALRSIVPNL